jgi:hypothetical protein
MATMVVRFQKSGLKPRSREHQRDVTAEECRAQKPPGGDAGPIRHRAGLSGPIWPCGHLSGSISRSLGWVSHPAAV